SAAPHVKVTLKLKRGDMEGTISRRTRSRSVMSPPGRTGPPNSRRAPARRRSSRFSSVKRSDGPRRSPVTPGPPADRRHRLAGDGAGSEGRVPLALGGTGERLPWVLGIPRRGCRAAVNAGRLPAALVDQGEQGHDGGHAKNAQGPLGH